MSSEDEDTRPSGERAPVASSPETDRPTEGLDDGATIPRQMTSRGAGNPLTIAVVEFSGIPPSTISYR